jgi:hypothetical protein
MFMRWKLAALVAAALYSGSALHAQALGTAFTYQGELHDSAAATLNGSYDFQFTLFDALNAGAQVGAIVNANGVSVNNGIFTVALDFGDQFTGQKRFLAIAVRQTGQPSFTALVPRQELRPAPYAQHADFVADNTIVGATILDGSITALDLADGAVTTNKLANLAVTTPKLANDSVTQAKIAAGAVGLAQINTTQVQARISGSCPSGQPLLGFSAAGTPLCDVSSNTISTNVDALGSQLGFALRTDGRPVISYLSSLSPNQIHLINCTDDQCNGFTDLSPGLDANNSGSSVAVRSSNEPIIAYSFTDLIGTQFVRLYDCNSNECTSGTDRTLNFGIAPAVAIRTGDEAIVAFQGGLASDDLVVYDCADANCAAGTARTLVSANNTGGTPAIAIRGNGRPIISFKDLTNGDLRIYDCNDTDCATGVERNLVTANDVGGNSSIAQNSQGDIVISYFDTTNNNLMLTFCEFADCNNANAADITTTTLSATGDVGQFSQVLLRANDFPLVLFWDETNGNAKIYDCNNIKCTSGSERTIEGANNGPSVGKYIVGAMRNGKPVAAYNNLDLRDIVVRSCGTETCNP